MEKGYKKSKELGRQPPEEETTLTEEELDDVADLTEAPVKEFLTKTLEMRTFWRDSYIGDATEGAVIKSDFVKQMEMVENMVNKTVVGIIILEDGTIQILMGE